jgi:hypothetical protein
VDAVATLQREIEGRGTAQVEAYSVDDSLQLGWARISTDDNIAVEVIYSIFDTSGQLLTTTSILPREALMQGTLLVNLDAQSSLASALAIVNPPANGEQAVIAAQVYDEFGNAMGQVQVTLEPGEGLSQNWIELVPALAGLNGFSGSAEFSSSVPVSMLSLRQGDVQLTTRDTLGARAQ